MGFLSECLAKWRYLCPAYFLASVAVTALPSLILARSFGCAGVGLKGQMSQARRRIQPELVSPSQAAANPLFVQKPHDRVKANGSECQTPQDLREQARFAAANLGRGRKMWFDLSGGNNEVNYRKVCYYATVWLSQQQVFHMLWVARGVPTC